MDDDEFDALCRDLEPRPGNDSWDLDPDYQTISHPVQGTGSHVLDVEQ